MAAVMEKTGTPGVFRRGSRYVVVFRDQGGAQRKEAAPTYKAALALKAARTAARDQGDYQPASRQTFEEFAADWITRYQGRGGRHTFTDDTRAEYARDLKRYAYPVLGAKRITALTPRDLSAWVAWLADDQAQGEHRAREQDLDPASAAPRRLTDGSIARIAGPVRACLRAARHEGAIRHNPAQDLALPKRDPLPDGDEEGRAKALTRAELARLLDTIEPGHRPFFRLLAATGLRIGEGLALTWQDVDLDARTVRVRRSVRHGREKAPKSRHGRRTVPIPAGLARELREWRMASPHKAPGDPVLATVRGTRADPDNLRRRVLAPAAKKAGVPWAGFHAFRHTFASLHIEAGTNIVRLSRLLGHHAPAFTLDTYAHLLDDGLGQGLDLDAELARGGNKVATGAARNPRHSTGLAIAEIPE
ncbi:MAG: site-specific integrase [Solirubrobacteraceae bacterium]